MTPPTSRIKDLLGCFSDRRLVVVGDLMLDRFIYGDVERISPEAPVPVVRVRRQSTMPGGASNVARNVRALLGHAEVVGLIGEDREADDLLQHLKEEGVSIDHVVREPNHQTIVKTRIIAERQQLVRVDWDPDEEPGSGLVDRLGEAARAAVAQADGVILEDYGKGVVQQQVVDAVLAAAATADIPSGFDPKDNHTLAVKGVTLATPNRREAFHAAGFAESAPGEDPLEDQALRQVGERLLEAWQPRHLLITLGAHGMLLLSGEEAPVHVPTQAREVFDVSGAGDTVIATCLLALAAGAEAREAAELANLAAGVVVAKLGTATCTPNELMGFIS